MRKALYILFVFLPLVACNEKLNHTDLLVEAESDVMTKSEGGYSGINPEFAVSQEEIVKYVRFRELSATEEFQFPVQSILPYGHDEDSPVVYIVNYQDGWEIVSADKRTPVVLAHSGSGHFNWDDLCADEAAGGPLLWISSLMEEVRHFDEVAEKAINNEDIAEKVRTSLTFWARLVGPEEIETKANPGPMIIHEGHWELQNVYSQVVEEIPIKLTQTTWGQRYNYNDNCPLKSNSQTERAPAGCAAIAGAQMLYYLKNGWNVPFPIPYPTYWTGNTSSHTLSLGTPSTSIWSWMANNIATGETASLIAYMGSLLNTYYSDTSGATLFSAYKFQHDVFPLFGIDCTMDTFDTNTVTAELLNGYPVICSAYPELPVLSDLPNIFDGHVFLIDGLKIKKIQHTYVYEWVYDNVDLEEMLEVVEPIVEVSYSYEPMESISMNWGWYGSYNNYWYAPSGDWEAGDETYVYKLIVYDFSYNE